jgi:pimeloyl-ACP methyl ester carboxylesterase
MGMKLYFDEKGSGVPIIFLHGFPFDHQIWDPLSPHLPDGFRYIMPDVRGFGKSVTGNSDYLMAEMAEDVIQLMDDEGIPSAILIGHSMGGYLALDITRQVPNRINGLGLLASHIYCDPPDIKTDRIDKINKLKTLSTTTVFNTMPEILTTNPQIQEYCREAIQNADVTGIQRALSAMASRPSSESLWSSLTIPKLLLIGRDDQFIPLHVSEAVAYIGKDVTYSVLENAGHMLMREQPAETARVLETFFRQIQRD